MSKIGPERTDLRKVSLEKMMTQESGAILGDPSLGSYARGNEAPDVRGVGSDMLKRAAGVGQRASK